MAGATYPNLTVKKIPKQVLSRCEWGHDDYSLEVENLPKAPPPRITACGRSREVRRKRAATIRQSLFGEASA